MRFSFGRIKEGIHYLKENDDAMSLSTGQFGDENSAQLGKRAYGLEETGKTELIWRPFQLAFALMCLPSVSERDHPDSNVFDLIWFPTGGGKTEAYLLLSAYVLLLRRIRNPETSVWAQHHYALYVENTYCSTV